jgi:hypothetical protein
VDTGNIAENIADKIEATLIGPRRNTKLKDKSAKTKFISVVKEWDEDADVAKCKSFVFNHQAISDNFDTEIDIKVDNI